MDIERRQHERQKLYSPEYVDMGAENGGVVVDLSEAGLGFHAVGRMEKGGNVTLSFSLGSGYRIAARARVAWLGPNGKFGGTTFTALPADSRSIIREWLTKAAAERVAPQEAHGAAPAVDPETIADENERASLLPSIIERVETPRAAMPTPPPPPAQPFGQVAAPVPVLEPIAPIPEDSSAMTKEQSRDEEARDQAHDSPSLSPIVLPSDLAAESAEQKTAAAELPARSEAATPPVMPQRPIFPPRNTGELFSRSPWISGQSFPEEPRSHKRLTAVIAICLLIIAAIASVPYVRAHRQQIGDAVMQAGRKVAGESAPNATPPPQIPAQASSQPSAQSVAPSPNISSPAAGASAAASPATGSAAPGSGTTGNAASANTPAASASPLKSSAAVPPVTSNTAPATSASQPPTAIRPAVPSPNAPSSSASRASRGATPLATTSPTANLPADTGQTEFQRAQQYLNGTGVAADPAEAAQWFWRSFEKGNSRAAVPLADLYLKGQGVSRSCLQARILLTVAARKGNADAAERLSQLPENCE